MILIVNRILIIIVNISLNIFQKKNLPVHTVGILKNLCSMCLSTELEAFVKKKPTHVLKNLAAYLAQRREKDAMAATAEGTVEFGTVQDLNT